MVGVDDRAGVVTPLALPCSLCRSGTSNVAESPPPVLAYPCALMAKFAKNARGCRLELINFSTIL